MKASGLKPVTRARVAAVENRHIVLLRHTVNGREEGQEVLLRIDVLFPVG